jgi:three-Cys-motif partner protein
LHRMGNMKYSEIGFWSEAKLDIILKYARAYSAILNKRDALTHIYIDAFAGPGLHRAKLSGRPVAGSPLNALTVTPPFAEHHFIDLDNERVQALEELAGTRPDVRVYHGDSNEILISDIFPHLHYKSFRRALCLLDPYGLHLNWEVIKMAGDLGTIDIFLNFPIHDINRTVLVKDPSEMDPRQVRRMDAFWGDNSWREVAYATDANLQRVAMILTHANHSFVNACRASPSKRFCVADCEAGQLHCKPLYSATKKGLYQRRTGCGIQATPH